MIIIGKLYRTVKMFSTKPCEIERYYARFVHKEIKEFTIPADVYKSISESIEKEQDLGNKDKTWMSSEKTSNKPLYINLSSTLIDFYLPCFRTMLMGGDWSSSIP